MVEGRLSLGLASYRHSDGEMVSLSRLFRSPFRHLLTLVLAALKNPWMQNQMKNGVVSLDGSYNGVGRPYRPFGMSRYVGNMDGVCWTNWIWTNWNEINWTPIFELDLRLEAIQKQMPSTDQ